MGTMGTSPALTIPSLVQRHAPHLNPSIMNLATSATESHVTMVSSVAERTALLPPHVAVVAVIFIATTIQSRAPWFVPKPNPYSVTFVTLILDFFVTTTEKLVLPEVCLMISQLNAVARTTVVSTVTTTAKAISPSARTGHSVSTAFVTFRTLQKVVTTVSCAALEMKDVVNLI
jgi:hypothetical protein